MATYYTNWSISNTSSPSKSDGYYYDIRYKFIVTETTNSNNTSTFTVKKYAIIYSTFGSQEDRDLTLKSRMPSNGTYQSDTKRVWSTSNINNYTLVGTDTFTISHQSDGTGTTSFNGAGSYTGGEGQQVTRQVTKTGIVMTRISVPSSITSNATDATKFGDTITFTITKALEMDNYIHTIKYSMYDANGTIASGVESTYNWTIPINLVNSTPNNAEPIISITCETYDGETLIGTRNYSFKCLVPSEYKPTASLSIEEIGDIPTSWGVYVQGKSKIRGTITTSHSISGDNSTIASYLTNTGVNLYTSNPFETDYILNNGMYTITSNVTDSRGRTSNNATLEISVLPYIIPTIKSLNIQRCNSNGVADEYGTYGKATIEYEISPLGNHNTKTIGVSFGQQTQTFTPSEYSGTHTFSTLFSGLDEEQSYTFIFKVGDYFYDNIQQTYTLLPSFVTESDLGGGKGVTWGRLATEEGLHDYMGFTEHIDMETPKLSINGFRTEKYGNVYISYIEE